jgi:hypothetical protein
MLRTFIQILALITTLESAIFLARGSLGLSAEVIATLGGTYVGYNPLLIQTLAQQTADYRAGVILLLLAFSLQMGNTLWPLRWKDFEVSRKGAVLATAVGVVIMTLAWILTNSHAVRIEREVREVLERVEQKAPVLR